MISQFVKDIFFPEKVGSYYPFSKYIVGIEINKANIIATKICLQGRRTIIESILEEKFEAETTQELADEEIIDPLTKALQAIFSKIGYYDEVYTTISSSFVVFKEMRLPFTSREKIAMVIDFEIEPLLPFSLRDAVVDFIITKEITEEKSSEILVTAVQKQHIINLLAVFEKAGVNPDRIIVDMIALYGLYKRIPAYNDLQGGAALIDIGYYTTRIALMVNAQLKTIRTLPKGVLSITKATATALNVPPNEVLDKMIRFGTEDEHSTKYTKEMHKAITSLLDEINFTFTSFVAQVLDRNPIAKIVLVGDGSAIKELTKYLTEKIKVPCEQFNTAALLEDPTIEVKNDCVITTANLISVSAALSSTSFLEGYNLKSKELTTPSYSRLLKQSITLLVLTVTLFATLMTHYTLQTRKLEKEITSSQQEALHSLKEVFKSVEDETSLNDAIETAQLDLKQQEETWFAFSNKSRASFLQCLLELASKIDQKSIGLDVEQLTIAEGTITLKAEVRDHDALKTLERELGQSKLLNAFEPQESLQFSMKITLPQANKETSE